MQPSFKKPPHNFSINNQVNLFIQPKKIFSNSQNEVSLKNNNSQSISYEQSKLGHAIFRNNLTNEQTKALIQLINKKGQPDRFSIYKDGWWVKNNDSVRLLQFMHESHCGWLFARKQSSNRDSIQRLTKCLAEIKFPWLCYFYLDIPISNIESIYLMNAPNMRDIVIEDSQITTIKSLYIHIKDQKDNPLGWVICVLLFKNIMLQITDINFVLFALQKIQDNLQLISFLTDSTFFLYVNYILRWFQIPNKQFED